mgnify:CR=1 FL=1
MIRAVLLPAEDRAQKLDAEILSLQKYLERVRGQMEEQLAERVQDQDLERLRFNQLIEQKVRTIVDLEQRLQSFEAASLAELVMKRIRSQK